jgi:hypothetical protein
MGQVLMPKATAVWLIENTALTFDQVAEFCGLHPLEVQSIADGEVAIGMAGFDPITNGQLTKEEIERCSADPTAQLQLADINVPRPSPRTSGPRYTPVARRQDRPDGIAWLLRNFPELTDGQIARLVGTTKPTINGIRDRTHWNIANIKPRDPVALGLCAREDLSAAIEKARRAVERAEKRTAKQKAKTEDATVSEESSSAPVDGKPIQSEDDIPGVADQSEAPAVITPDVMETAVEPQSPAPTSEEQVSSPTWPPTDT